MSTAELIVQADTVHTLDPDLPHAEAVAIRAGQIVAVGRRQDVREWRGRRTETVELGSATITPGLVDGHIHPVFGLDLTRGADLSAVDSIAALVVELRRLAPDPGSWLEGWGLNPNLFGTEPVTSAPLIEALGPDALVLLVLFDAHSALASPAALAHAGISGPRRFDGAAAVVCDAAGVPTGHLLELPAYELVRSCLPAEPGPERRRHFRTLLAAMAATGITAGNVMDFEADSHDLVTAAAATDDGLPIRLRFAPFCMPGVTRELVEEIVELQRLRGPRWQVEGVKFMIDGTIDNGTAWLSEPDCHGQSTAPFWPEPQAYAEIVTRLAALGVPTVTHAIGDAGVRFVLDTLARLPDRRTRPFKAAEVPHRIEHLETLPDDLVPRFAAQNVTASLQPTHCTLYGRADQTDNWSIRLGPERAGRAWRTGDLRAAGARVALGSDWPIAPYDARSVLADTQLRRQHGHLDDEPILRGQGLSALMALEGYTTHAAAAAGLAAVSGRIRPGFRADLSCFRLDPLLVPPDELAESPVPLTVVEGTVVHRAE